MPLGAHLERELIGAEVAAEALRDRVFLEREHRCPRHPTVNDIILQHLESAVALIGLELVEAQIHAKRPKLLSRHLAHIRGLHGPRHFSFARKRSFTLRTYSHCHCHSALAHADRRENFTVEARSAEHFRDEPVSLSTLRCRRMSWLRSRGSISNPATRSRIGHGPKRLTLSPKMPEC